MNKFSLVLLCIGAAALAPADDLVTKSGRVYKDFALMGAASTGIRVSHSSGISVVKVNDFPDNLSPEMKALVKKYEKDIPEAKKRAEERRKKREAALRKKRQAEAKIAAEQKKKFAAFQKKDEAEKQKLQDKIKKSAVIPKNPFKKK